MQIRVPRLATFAAAGLALSGCADEETIGARADTGKMAPVPVAGQPDPGTITLRGRVVSTTPSSFVLDYGSGNATVEMDDWDWFQEGRAINPGDRVTVTGRVDGNLMSRASIEARSVYVENLGSVFYASSADEERWLPTTFVVASEGATDVTGTISALEGREFTVGTGAAAVRVDTSEMSSNPLDAQGSPQLRVGDQVYVWGRLDIDSGEQDELMAQGVTTLVVDRGRSMAQSGQGAGNAQQPAPAAP